MSAYNPSYVGGFRLISFAEHNLYIPYNLLSLHWRFSGQFVCCYSCIWVSYWQQSWSSLVVSRTTRKQRVHASWNHSRISSRRLGLVDRTARQYDGQLALSCRLFVRPSVCLWRCALWLSGLVYMTKSCTRRVINLSKLFTLMVLRPTQPYIPPG